MSDRLQPTHWTDDYEELQEVWFDAMHPDGEEE